MHNLFGYFHNLLVSKILRCYIQCLQSPNTLKYVLAHQEFDCFQTLQSSPRYIYRSPPKHSIVPKSHNLLRVMLIALHRKFNCFQTPQIATTAWRLATFATSSLLSATAFLGVRRCSRLCIQPHAHQGAVPFPGDYRCHSPDPGPDTRFPGAK